jgi:hypothetical protein
MKQALALLLTIFVLNASALNNDPIKGTSVKGQVVESGTGELLSGVRVVVKGTDIITYTDREGRFEVVVPNGASQLDVQLVSFESMEVNLNTSNINFSSCLLELNPR